ncbi:site-specific integrase [Maribellus sp. YY47]|uniref:tyrosine-type recombinase/integrase n=1 Tax=Maribellus sp. YY47 TaxID=2929486 RepID=UPI0020016779|nr:site-specific integrase [Maribellus sp. YY47]MCK3686159.1 site-specific integrase [Maribellus sp. YY47]
MTTKVTLRQKEISKGRKSLYLDFYPPIPHPETGEPTRREFLGLYIFKETTTGRNGKEKKVVLNPIDKQHNTDTLKIADSIRQKRENFLNKPEIYNEYEKEQLRKRELGEQSFIDYFKKLTDKKKESNRNSWLSTLNYLEAFTNGKLKFADLNERFLEDFKEYLLTTKSTRSEKTTLSTNSAVSYFNKVKAALKQAYKDGILQTDLNSKLQPIKAAETRREYLTIDELNRLVKTPCNDPLLKRAALFSSLTGLRFSDIQKMVWREIEYIEGQGYFLNFLQKKTKGVEVLPISEQAYSICGSPGDSVDKVFEGLKYSAYANKHLSQWIGAAGITKDITFHCFRHTYATLQLFNGTDIYTVSKMLGHKDLKTTQVYANIVDKAKREATNKIILDF